MTEQFANNAESTLSGAINNSVTSLVVASATAFPSAGNFRIRMDSELMLVTAVSSNTFTVTRGAEGTTAASHSDGVLVKHVLTAAALDFGWTKVTKTGDESVTSSTTLQTDDHLFFTPTSGTIYEVEVDVFCSSASATPDIKVAFGEDTTDRGVWLIKGFSTGDSLVTSTNVLAANNATALFGLASTARLVTIRGWYRGNGAQAGLYWAQNTSNGTASTVLTGSVLRYRAIYP